MTPPPAADSPVAASAIGAARPPASFAFGAWLFLRLLALVHLIAFGSAWAQLNGLIGANGLLPADRFLHAVREHLGNDAYWQLPTLCWLFGADAFLHVLSATGIALSLLVFAGIAPALGLGLLWTLYLSLSAAGQIFFNFQWDALLLETTLLAVFLAPWKLLPLWQPYEPPRVARWLLWWLLLRLMFLSGVVKLTSGDPLWANLTALTGHYETQPLPTPLAWYVHQLPAWFHRASCTAMFTIELVAPFALFGPRLLRHNATLLLIALMVGIALTGNYTFFNLLSFALCLLCFDNVWWSRLRLLRLHPWLSATIRAEPRSPWATWPLRTFALAIVVYTGLLALPALKRTVVLPDSFRAIANVVSPFRSLNTYGLFAVMTPTRPEIVIEGSADGRTWLPYEFAWKPGDLKRRPGWVAPHQPRLDWQMWFAALGSPEHNRWVLSLCEHLLRGTPEVLALLATNPFADQPPRFIRAVRYEYRFTDYDLRARTDQWWRRSVIDYYLPPASLR